MSPAALEKWRAGDEPKSVGAAAKGGSGGESVGHGSGGHDPQ